MPTCINHPAAEETRPCAACARPFCTQCRVEIMGSQLCQDCKATALVSVYERRTQHPLAAMSLIVPIAGYLLCFPIPITSAVGLWLSRKVLRELSQQPHLAGRSVALAGLVVSGGTLGTWLVALAATVLMRFMG